MICQNCGYRMGEGLRFCPKCASPTRNFKPIKIQIPKEKKNRDSNKENDEINQWFDMGLF